MGAQGIHDGHRERMREKFLESGPDSFQDHELLELLLFYALPRINTNEIAHALLKQFGGTLYGVLSAPVSELAKVPRMGVSSAVLLHLVFPLFRRAQISDQNETVLDTSDRLGTFFLRRFLGQPNEILYQICLDAKGKILNCKKLCEGDMESVHINTRMVVENALRSNATMVALAHNHPSGMALPSQSDIEATRQIQEGLAAINIHLADHIIVAGESYVSMRQEGLL